MRSDAGNGNGANCKIDLYCIYIYLHHDNYKPRIYQYHKGYDGANSKIDDPLSAPDGLLHVLPLHRGQDLKSDKNWDFYVLNWVTNLASSRGWIYFLY